MEPIEFRVLTVIGAIASAGTVGLYSYHAQFFARQWTRSKTARLMSGLFALSALNGCMDVIFSGMLAAGARPGELVAALYPLWLFLLVCTAILLHRMVGHFEAIVDAQENVDLGRGGPKQWGD